MREPKVFSEEGYRNYPHHLDNPEDRQHIITLRKMINKRYSRSFWDRITDSCGEIGQFMILCLAIIFQPLNLIIIGIIIVLCLLI